MKSINRREARRLIEQPDPKYPTGLRNRIILRLMYEAGLRVSEIPALRRDDLDLIQGTITAGEGRTRRSMPLLAAALEDLRKWMRQHPGGEWLTPTLKAGAISAAYLRDMVKREGQAVGLPGITPRVLRDTCGLELAGEFSTEEITQLMGFADRRAAEKFRREAPLLGVAERMRARELQAPLPEKPSLAETVEKLLADPAAQELMITTIIEKLGAGMLERLGATSGDQGNGPE